MNKVRIFVDRRKDREGFAKEKMDLRRKREDFYFVYLKPAILETAIEKYL